MKKHKKVLEYLEQEKKRLDTFHYLNNIQPNEYVLGKLDLIKDLKKFINEDMG